MLGPGRISVGIGKEQRGSQMDEQVSHKGLFIESLDRCTDSNEFVSAFYERFVSSSEEVKRKFRNTDFKQQNQMLVRSLRLVAAATSGEQEGLQELRERAETHDRNHLAIKPELYELWRECVIDTACEYDPQWNDEVEDAWQNILTFSIDYMTRRF